MAYSNPRRTRDTNGLIAEVVFSRRSPLWRSRVSILTEGKEDANIYSELFNDTTTKIFISNGFNQLQKALKTLSDQFDDIIGIRDADFCHLTNEYPNVKNLFLTDCHDIEMTMFHTGSLLLTVFTKYGKEDKFNKTWAKSIKLASFTGYIRWYYRDNKIDTSAKFSLFDHSGLNIDNWDEDRLIAKINSKMQAAISLQIIHTFIEQHKTEDIYNLCNGHDIATLIMLALNVNKSRFLNDIIAVFKDSRFKETKLYHNLLDWQNKTGYILFEAA
jgi:hypothetical protein